MVSNKDENNERTLDEYKVRFTYLKFRDISNNMLMTWDKLNRE